MKKVKVLYIGNNLVKKTSNVTMMMSLSLLLITNGIDVYRSSNQPNKIIRLLDMCWSLFKLRNKVKFVLIDTYSTFNYYYAFIISQLARVYKIKYIPILHGGNLPSRLDNFPKMSKRIFENSFLNVAPSDFLKTEFHKRNFKSIVIPNSIEIDKYIFQERKIIKPNLLYVRSFSEIYNPTLAIKVLFELKKTYSDAKLCMIGPNSGDGSYDEVKSLIHKLELESSVVFTGGLEKTEWHKKSEKFDIFINTTNVDNTPVSVIEAMALGLVVVSTNVGGLPYLIRNKENGILVKADSALEMTNAIKYLLSSSDKTLEMTINARKNVERFDENTVIKSWIEILN